MVVSDLQGSTALAERLDPESLRDVLDQYFDELGRVLESLGGRIEKRIGDAMVTVFGLPAPRPDDALRAVQAVAECQATLANLNDRLGRTAGVHLTNRTGVSTGRVIFAEAGAGHRVLAGEALEIASGLEPIAPPLEALLASTTIEAIGAAVVTDPLAPCALKTGAVVSAARLIGVDAPTESADRGDHAADRCSSCGTRIDVAAEPAWSWCPECGGPLSVGGLKQASRRTLTIVFADLRPSPSSADMDARRQATVRCFEVLREVLERHGATVEKFIGDAVMAVFGLTQRREDDALRAIRAAIEMQASLDRLNPVLELESGVRLELRIGVNTGPVIAGDPHLGQRLVTGDAVNVAARLEQTAGLGEVVIGGLTRRLAGQTVEVEELAPLTLKGKAEPVPASRVVRVASGSSGAAGLELPMVGRADQLEILLTAFRSAVDAQACRRVRILGDPGVGKSRLVHEFVDRIPGDVRVLRGGCLSYGEGITFWPVVELIQAASGTAATDAVDTVKAAVAAFVDDPAVAERLWSLAGLTDTPYPVPELTWAVRSMLHRSGIERPTVVIVDGLHWAEPTLIELLDDVVRNLQDAPVLLVTMERPSDAEQGASDDRPSEPTSDAVLLGLEPLDDAAAELVIAAGLGQGALPVALVERVKRAAAGNPLFLEQFLTMLIDDGLLTRQEGGWQVTGDIEHVSVPPTIEAVLAARIDALDDAQRGALEPASVIGREFSWTAVNSLQREPFDLDAALAALIRRQLVVPARDPDVFIDYRFRNLLVRDVVYDGLLKRTRSVLHQRFADWLLGLSSRIGRATEVQEILGYHLEQSYHLRSGLGTVDDETIDVGRRAADQLAPAGLRAFGRGDMPAAANLLGRAARTLAETEPTRPRLLARAGEARMETGAFREAIALYDEAEANATASGDPVAAGIAEIGRLRLRYLTGDGVTDSDARAIVSRLTPIFDAAGDHRALAQCHRLLFNVELTHSQWNAAGLAAEQMIAEARTAGDRLLVRRGLPALAGVAMYGPTPVPEAIERCEAVLAQAGDDRMARALTERAMAHLMALDGRFDEARDMCTATRARLIELGWHFDAALVSLSLGPIEILAGRPDDAARELRADYTVLKAMGEQNFIATIGAYLAEAVRLQGNLDEALELAAEAAGIAAEDDIPTQVAWRSTRAKALIDGSDSEEATRLAGEAVEIALGTDDPTMRGDALMDQGTVLVRGGEVDGARRSIEAARLQYRAKRHRVGVRMATRALKEISR